LTAPFDEQAEILNRLADRGYAPKIYAYGENYYVSGKVEGPELRDIINGRLTPQQRQALADIDDALPARPSNEQALEAIAAKQKIVAQAFVDDPDKYADLDAAMGDFINALREENIEIVDLHWANIKCVDADCSRLMALDAGFSLKEPYSKMGDPGIAELYAFNALTGGNFDIGPRASDLIDRALARPPSTILVSQVDEFGDTILPKPVTRISEDELAEGVTRVPAAEETTRAGSFADPLPPCTIGGALAGRAIGCRIPTVSSDATFDKGAAQLEGKRYTYDPIERWTQQRTLWFDKKLDSTNDAEIIAQLETARIEKVIQPKNFDDVEKGKTFFVHSYTDRRHVKGGEFIGISRNELGYRDISMRNGFDFENIRSETTPSNFIAVESVDLNSLVVEGDIMRITTSRIPGFEDKSLSGLAIDEQISSLVRFDGFSNGRFRVTRLDNRQEVLVNIGSINFNKIIREGDEVIVQANFPAGFREQAVTELRGKYVGEDAESLTLYVDGKVVKYDKNNLDIDSLEKAEYSAGVRAAETQDFPLPLDIELTECSASSALVGQAAQIPCIPSNIPTTVTFDLPPSELPPSQPVAQVQGYKNIVSNLYDSVTPENIDEIFQNQLESIGPNIYGGKAVAYIHDDGRVQVAFLTETVNTHHRHALGTITGGEKGNLVYNGQYDNYLIADIPSRSFGFEFQYDRSSGKIIGIQASSQISNVQKAKGATGWTLPEHLVNHVEQEMLDKIDLDLIDESLVDKPLEVWVDKSRIPVAESAG